MRARLASRPVALIGLSGAGKSTVAPVLAARLGGEAIDLDVRVEALAGCRIAELFTNRGEAEFRRLEREALADALDGGACVIACGGGIVESPSARRLLRERCRCVWLEVAPAVAAARVTGGSVERPLLGPDAPVMRLDELLARRRGWYAEVAALRVATDRLAPADVAERVGLELGRMADAEGAA